MSNEYQYEALYQAAIKNPTQENLTELAEWFERYDMRDWNGEGWVMDKTRLLKPIWSEDLDEYDNYQLLGYEIADF